MLHTCVERFNVMGERENILGWDGEVNRAQWLGGNAGVRRSLLSAHSMDRSLVGLDCSWSIEYTRPEFVGALFLVRSIS
jgi:hypothetical protein